MKKFVVFIIALVVTLTVSAVPAKRNTKRVVTLTDGQRIEVTLVGDEHGHWYIDAEGRALSVEDDVASYISANKFEARMAKASARRQKSNARRIERMEARRAKASTNGMHKVFGEPTPLSGKKKGLVILVNFKDVQFKSANNQALFNRRFNEAGYNNASGYIGSVHDYFLDQSYGKFDLTFDVVGPVTVSKNMAYYGGNDENDEDSHPAEMVIEALNLVDSQVDFKNYDWDNNGEVDQVFCIYAGMGEASGGSDDTIWPHEFDLYSAGYWGDGSGIQRMDNVNINTYAVSCELADATNIDGIGTACHEFSHCLGYADLYDTSYSGFWGMNAWSLMDGGSYNGPNYRGEVPCGYSAYDRWWAGWLDLVELKGGEQITDMAPLNDNPVGYVIYNDAHKDECYVLENRNNTKWFSYVDNNKLNRQGMLVTHIDYNKLVWQDNTVNTEVTSSDKSEYGYNTTNNHARYSVVPANNQKGTWLSYYGYYDITASQYAGHLYPSGTNNKLTRTSTPAASTFNANTDKTKFLNKYIENIKVNADYTISFDCTVAGSTGGGGGTGGGQSGDYIFYESFDNCEGEGGNDDKWSGISDQVTLAPDNSGWSGNLWAGSQCLRAGTGKNAANITSPSFTLNGDAVLSFKAGAWNKDGKTLTVYLGSSKIEAVTMPQNEWGDFQFNITGGGSCMLKFQAAGRFFLDEVLVLDPNTTGIDNILVSPEYDGRVYNLQGQEVKSPKSGNIYIKNGRKFLCM